MVPPECQVRSERATVHTGARLYQFTAYCLKWCEYSARVPANIGMYAKSIGVVVYDVYPCSRAQKTACPDDFLKRPIGPYHRASHVCEICARQCPGNNTVYPHTMVHNPLPYVSVVPGLKWAAVNTQQPNVGIGKSYSIQCDHWGDPSDVPTVQIASLSW